MKARIAAVVATGGALLAVAVPTAGAVTTSQALDRALDRIMAARGHPPGLSVLIARPGGTELWRRGVADVGTGRRPAAGDPYRIASAAKAFNAAVVLSLVSERRLSLRDTIGQRLPGLLPLASNVTLGQVLGHTGGLADYIRDPDFIAVLRANPRGYLTPRQMLGFVRDSPLHFSPGTRYEYSDTDNVVAGLMAEVATRQSYETLLRQRVARPLGLRHTTLPRTVALPRGYLRGYEVPVRGRPLDVSYAINPALAWASGGIVSTPSEVGVFFGAMLAGRLFDPPERRAQHRFRPGQSSPPGPGRNDAGLGLFRYTTRCGRVFGHTGSFPGYRVFGAASGDGRRAVVFTVNAQIVPGEGSPRVSSLIRVAQEAAVCRTLG